MDKRNTPRPVTGRCYLPGNQGFHTGTVTSVSRDGSFAVSWDRVPREPRRRDTYPLHAWPAFGTGRPPLGLWRPVAV